MSEPDFAAVEAGFARTYRRIVEFYDLDPTVSTGQLRSIMERVEAERSLRRKPQGRGTEQRGGIRP